MTEELLQKVITVDALCQIFNALESNKLSSFVNNVDGIIADSLVIGSSNSASSYGSLAHGLDVHAEGYYSHAHGQQVRATGLNSYAQGGNVTASGSNSHAEGYNYYGLSSTRSLNNNNYHYGALGNADHSEGYSTIACSSLYTQDNKYGAHAEGYYTAALNQAAHAEGSTTIAEGLYSHAEGYHTQAIGTAEHVSGVYNKAGNHQEVADWANNTTYKEGDLVYTSTGPTDPVQIYQCNTNHTSSTPVVNQRGYWTGRGQSKWIEAIGNGYDNFKTQNARTLDWQGNEVLSGKLTVGVAPTANMDVTTKKYVDDLIAGLQAQITALQARILELDTGA